MRLLFRTSPSTAPSLPNPRHQNPLLPFYTFIPKMPSLLLLRLSKPYRTTISSLLLLLLFSVLLVFYTLYHGYPTSQSAPRPSQNDPADTRRLFLSLSAGANASIAAHLRALTLHPHLAGTPSAAPAAAYVLRHLRLAGLRTHTKDYRPLLSYPLSSSLSLLSPNGTLIKRLSLAEPADPAARAVPPYHAYSPSGSALAPPVYVNYGREEDYEALRRLGVDVKGCVVIVRRGGGYRGAVVKRAAERGAAAVLVFGAADGGVERGVVLLGGPGDPLTPGWAAVAEGERLGDEDEEVRRRFPAIPSMPLAAETAAEILRALGGPPVPHEWRAGLEIEVYGVGAGPALVNFKYREDRKLAMIRNVFGVIRGREEPDRYVILGNHRDAWTYGAVDPNSGTAALLDVARRYGVLLHTGWRPRRTIILCSWDAEEFGMIGSTEWVEQNLGNLEQNAVAYLNVDCAVQGAGFFADGTPQLDKLLVEVTKQIKDPDSEDMTVYETWVAANGGISIERLARADSDFSSFLHHAGVPSIDLYYGREFPVYHTAYDSFDWMEKHADPVFHRHVAVAEVWGILGLHLADDLVLPFDYLSYAAQLQEHTSVLTSLLDGEQSLKPINISINELAAAASEAQEEARRLREEVNNKDFIKLRRRAFNDRVMLAERGFLEAEGLRGRQWFKHLVYAPPEDTGSKLSFFPGIADAIARARKNTRKEGLTRIQHEIWRVARAIQRTAGILRGDLV